MAHKTIALTTELQEHDKEHDKIFTLDGGLEPPTTWLKVKRSTDWANRVYTLGGIRTHEEINQQLLRLPRLTAPEPVFVFIHINIP